MSARPQGGRATRNADRWLVVVGIVPLVAALYQAFLLVPVSTPVDRKRPRSAARQDAQSPERSIASVNGSVDHAQRVASVPAHAGVPDHPEDVAKLLAVGVELDVMSQGLRSVVQGRVDFTVRRM
jgi:hypothetical protein